MWRLYRDYGYNGKEKKMETRYTVRILPWVFKDLRKNTSWPDQPFVWEFTALRGFARECAVFTSFSMQKRVFRIVIYRLKVRSRSPRN